ncbi:MAG: hypothetical protein AAFO96_29040, partial [Bacteroidota bacterium]
RARDPPGSGQFFGLPRLSNGDESNPLRRFRWFYCEWNRIAAVVVRSNSLTWLFSPGISDDALGRSRLII